MDRLFVFILSFAMFFVSALAIPVTQKLVRLQPVPKNFLDWSDSARRQVLTAMDQAVIPSVRFASYGAFICVAGVDAYLRTVSDTYGDFRHLIDAGAMTPGDPSDGGHPTRGGDLSFSSSSWSSMSTDGDEPEDMEVGRMIYRHLYRYLSGNAWDAMLSSIGSQSSSDSVVSASPVDGRGDGGFADHLPVAVREPPVGLTGGSADYSLSSYSDIGQSSSEEGGVTEQLDVVGDI